MFLPRPALLLLVALAPSCASPPAPLAVAELAPKVVYGVAGGGTTDRPEPAALAGYICELFAVDQPPAGVPIAQAATAIISDRGAPFRGKSNLPIGTLWLTDAAAVAWRAASAEHSPLEVQRLGSVAAVVASDLSTSVVVDLPAWPEVHLTPGPDGIAIAIVSHAEPTPPDPLGPLARSDDRGAGAEVEQAREELRLEDRLSAGACAALFLPDPAIGRGGRLLLLRPDTVPTAAELAAAERQARAELAMATEPSERPRPRSWQVALNAIGERNRRPALLAVAAPLDLPRVLDVILAADEPDLIAFTERLRSVDPDAPDRRWLVERSVWAACVQSIERGEVSEPVLAALIRHLGALADDPATLQLLLQTNGDCDSFGKALLEENLAALADRSSATRVTAHTWLQQHGTTVPDYEPLAEQPARRRALRRFQQQQARADGAGSER